MTSALDDRRPRLPRSWWPDVILVVALAAIVADMLWGSQLLALDDAATSWAESNDTPGLYVLGRVLFFLGQGLPLAVATLLVAIVATVRLRSPMPLIAAGATYIAFRLIVGVAKMIADRGAPRSGQIELYSLDNGLSFPSGHAANCIVWYGLMALMLYQLGWSAAGRVLWQLRWVLAAANIAAMVYVRFHWVTDAIAGLLLGILILRQVHRVFFRSKWHAMDDWRALLPARMRRQKEPPPGSRQANSDSQSPQRQATSP